MAASASNALIQRFSKAILSARALPPNLLTQAQKLKLYALFQQASKGPPPADQPADAAAELDRAKWEAWHDVRGLSNAQAMESYSQIIENLEELVREAMPSPVPKPQWDSGGQPLSGARESCGTRATAGDETGYDYDDECDEGDDDEDDAEDAIEEVEDDDDDDDDDDDQLAMRLVSEESEPLVTATVWSTAAISVGAGTKLDVPLSLENASRCTYAFSIVAGSGPVGFRINTVPPREMPLVDLYQSAAEGALEVEGPAVLMATLDNTSAVVSSVDLKCRVCLEPLVQLAGRAQFAERQQIRQQLQERMGAIDGLADAAATHRSAARQVEGRLAELKRTVASTEQELKGLVNTLHAAEGEQRACRQEIRQLKQALRNKLTE